jgi:hypothetical protein
MSISNKSAIGKINAGKTRSRRDFINQTIGGIAFLGGINGEDTLMFLPAYYIDISDTESVKQRACFAHASQSPERFYSLQEQVSKFRGLESGCKIAEAFIQHVQSCRGLLPV